MPLHKDPFRAFQEELAGLDRQIAAREAAKPEEDRLSLARAKFQELRDRYQLTVADAVSFFPEEEGIAYLQQLIAASQGNPPRKRKVAGGE